MSWRETTVGEFVNIKHGFAFKGDQFNDHGPFVVLTPGNCHNSGGFKDKGEKEKRYSGDVPDGYLLNKGDLLVVMTDLVGTAPVLGGSFIIPEDNKYLHNQRLGLVTVKDGAEADPLFLYHLFNTENYRGQVRGSASGATVRHTSPGRISACKVRVPDLPTQQRIAGILSAYDDLIENNRRRIGLLEQAARLLYREWFVHLRFPGHETAKIVDGLPEGWERATLGAVTDLTWGDTNTTKSAYVETGFDAYSASGLDGKLPKFDYDRDGIVLSAIGAQCGKTWLARGKWSCIKNTIRIFPTDDRLGLEYLYFATFGESFWPRRGAAQPFISQGDARRLTIPLPTSELMQKFSEFAYAALMQARTLTNEADALTRARDLLLPRLMDGRIPV